MGKNRQAHEIVEELMAVNGIDEKTLAEKVGVSELVIRNYLSGLNKDSRNYSRLKDKVKEAFGLGDDFFDESHVFVSAPVKEVKAGTKKPAKPRTKEKKESDASDVAAKSDVKTETKAGSKKNVPVSEEGVQLVFDQKGLILEEIKAKKQPAASQDQLMSSIKSTGSKAKLSGKKKDITPEAAEKWADDYEEEMKQSVGRAFSVLKESLKEVFKKEEAKPVYTNKKITELVELASKAKEDDLNLIIAMLKKITK